MYDEIERYLSRFKSCFSRTQTYQWFIVIIIGFMMRSDQLGITSVVRDMLLDGSRGYDSIHRFFYSKAWSLETLRHKWYEIVRDSAPMHRINERVVLAGDGIKKAKEARYMPGVKKLKQESEDSSKGEYIFGHMLGAVGVVLGEGGKLCLPLKINIQDGLQSAAKWANSTISAKSHVVQMIESSFEVARVMGKSIVLMDRYFLSVPALKRLAELNAEWSKEETLLHIITKAKSNCVGYPKLEGPQEKHSGRPKTKGNPIKLSSLWDEPEKFQTAKATFYGKEQEVSYRSINLLWGRSLFQELQFVLVIWNGLQSILVSTDLNLSPIQIIEGYATRFKIENMFRALNQSFGGLCYHFWTKRTKKINRYKKKDDPDPLEQVTDENDQQLILRKIKAIEGFILVSSIAMGITQMLSLNPLFENDLVKCRWIRTPARLRVSEETVAYYMRKFFFVHMAKKPDSFITHFIIEAQQEESHKSEDI